MASDTRIRKIRRFLRQRSQLLTVIGMLVVFATFIIKDGLRDRKKDIGDSLQHAEDSFATNAGNTANRVEIERAVRMLDVLTMVDGPTKDRQWAAVQDLLDEVQWEMQQDALAIYELNHLLDVTGIPKSQIHGLDQIESDCRSLGAEWDAHYDKLDASRGIAINDIQDRFFGLERNITVVGNREFKDVETKRQQVERSYERYSIASYFLYALGWSLSLVGKIFGLPTVGA